MNFLKFVSAIFQYFFFCYQMLALKWLWKILFISSKKLFSFSKSWNFCISVFRSFFIVSHYFRGWLQINVKVYEFINCLKKNLITLFVWYLEKEKRYDVEILSIYRVLSKEHFMKKSCRKCASKASHGPLFNFGR